MKDYFAGIDRALSKYPGRPITKKGAELADRVEHLMKKRAMGKDSIRDLIYCEAHARTQKYPKILTEVRSYGQFIQDLNLFYYVATDRFTQADERMMQAKGVDELKFYTVACYDFMAHKMLRDSDEPYTFEIDADLAYCFMATDLKGVQGDDVKLPYEGFLVSVPKGVIQLTSDTGTHEVEYFMCCSIDSQHGPGIMVTILGGIGSKGDHGDSQGDYFQTPLPPGEDIDEAFSERILSDDVAKKAWTEHKVAMIGGEPVDMIGVRAFVMRYLVNVLLYIGGQEKPVRKGEAEIQKIRAKGKKARKVEQERLKRLEAANVFVVNTNVVLDPQMIQSLKNEVHESGGTAAWTLKYKTMVRGHWRNQAHGKGRKDRKWLFIAPHVRGKHLPDEVLPASHTYQVK